MISIIVPHQLAFAKLIRGITFNQSMLAGCSVELSTKYANLVFERLMSKGSSNET